MEPEKTPFMDRRQYTRLSETLTVKCARLGPPPARTPVEVHWIASSVDISEGGMLLRCTERLRMGEGLELLFELEKGRPAVRGVAHVVRYHAVMYDKIFYIPVAFTQINPTDRERLHDFVARQSAKH